MNRLHARATSGAGKREVRSIKVRELRTDVRDGQTYLTGYAANFNVLSEDLGGWRERILPGAFTRALAENQDVRHLQNHDPNLVLGRTSAGTTVLREDAKGLAFETRLGNRSYERDLAESVARGDVDEMSFGFFPQKQSWTKDQDPETGKDIEVRELHDVDLADIATVTYPAYPGTSAGLDSRALFPDGAPLELRSRVLGQASGRPADSAAMPVALERARELRTADGRTVEFRSSQADGVMELVMYDDIGENWWTGGGITAKSVKAALDAAATPFASIRLRINSFGGDASEATAIYNLLRAQRKPIECYIDGVAASAASVIAMAGDKIVMGTGALMMIHRSWVFAAGNCTEMREMADYLEIWDDAAAEIYAARTKQSIVDLMAMMDAETWMGGQECLDKGFCTALAERLEEDDEAVATAAERSSRLLATFRNAPARLTEAVEHRANRTNAERRMRQRLAMHIKF